MRGEADGIPSDVDVVVARALHGECGVRRAELDGVTRRQLAQVQRGMARRHAELNEIQLLVVETHLRAFRGAHERARTDLDLDVGPLPGIESVSRRERGIEPGASPVLSTGTPEGHVAVEVAQTRGRDLTSLRARGWR